MVKWTLLGDYWKDKYLNTELEVSHVYATSGVFCHCFSAPSFFPIVAFLVSSTHGHESRVNTTFRKLCCLYCCQQRGIFWFFLGRWSFPGSIFIEVFDYISHYVSVKRIESKFRRIQIISLGTKKKKSACIEIVQKYLNCSRTCEPLSTIMYEA